MEPAPEFPIGMILALLFGLALPFLLILSLAGALVFLLLRPSAPKDYDLP